MHQQILKLRHAQFGASSGHYYQVGTAQGEVLQYYEVCMCLV